MWSWVLHRITGVAIFFVLVVHVLGTAAARVSPQAYDEIVDVYRTPLAVLGEIVAVAAVLFHALNGIRVTVLDYWRGGRKYQRLTTWIVVAGWLGVVIAAVGVMGWYVAERLS